MAIDTLNAMLALIDSACRGVIHAPVEQVLSIFFCKKNEAVVSDSVCGANINIKIIMRFAIMILVIASLVFSGLV